MNELPPSSEEASASFSQTIKTWLKRLFGPKSDGSIKEAIEEAIEEVIEEREESGEAPLAPEEKTMLRNVLSFGDLTVQDIMVPRTDIIAVPVDIELDRLKKYCIEQRHTRMPVYNETLDKLEGFLHVKDLFAVVAAGEAFDVRRLLRPLLFVPPSMRIIDLLVKMRRQASHLAIVVDEYGGTDGLVTLENIFEEIVGDIQDEHDEDEDTPKEMAQIDANTFEADARMRIDRLERVLGVNLLNEHEGEEFDTLGGLIFFELGRVPARGEVIPHNSGLSFQIMEADPRRIKRVRIMSGRNPGIGEDE